MNQHGEESFHEFSIKSILFKGRPDLYFCYLKSEKIAHAIVRLFREAHMREDALADSIAHSSSYLPSAIAHFASGAFDENEVLADVFELLSLVRLSVTKGLLHEGNARIIVEEYERIAQKISLGKNASPLSLEDLSVPTLPAAEGRFLESHDSFGRGVALKDSSSRYKGHSTKDKNDKRQHQRTDTILKIVYENKGVSIKDILKTIKNCSAKTVQRDLGELIRQGLVRKEGKRRWSVYWAGQDLSSAHKQSK